RRRTTAELGYFAGLALPQPADGRADPAGEHGGDGRERRHALQDLAAGAGRIRPPVAPAGSGGGRVRRARGGALARAPRRALRGEAQGGPRGGRSEERRVGKEWRCGGGGRIE